MGVSPACVHTAEIPPQHLVLWAPLLTSPELRGALARSPWHSGRGDGVVTMGWWQERWCDHHGMVAGVVARSLRHGGSVITVGWWQGWRRGRSGVVAVVVAWSLHSPGCLLQGLCPHVAEYRFKRNGRRNVNFVVKRQQCFGGQQGAGTQLRDGATT